MAVHSELAAIWNHLETPFTGEALFDYLPDIVYFIKSTKGEYVVVNDTLVARCGKRRKSELIGRTPSEVLRPPLGRIYEAQDREVLRSGQPLIAQLELHVYPSRDVGWCLTTKLPLRKRGGAIVGIVGVSQDLRLPDNSADEYRHVLSAVAYAEKHVSTPPSVMELAEIAEMSRYQLDRRMQRVFGLTTGQWLLKMRMDVAQRQLRETKAPLSAVALQAGYADQSAFSRQFRQATGMSPREFRRLNN